jgi:hypothetical protein
MTDMRVTVTNLETFRLYRTEDWMDLDHLMSSFTGNEAFDPFTSQLGEAFHEALRKIGTGEFTYLQHGRFRFDLSRIEGELALYPLRELRASKKYRVGDDEIEVRGRVDGTDGVAVEDHKLKFGTFDAERYADSVQWKLYLDIMGGKQFRYNVFEGPDSDSVAMRSSRAAWLMCPCPEYVEQHTDDCNNAAPCVTPLCMGCPGCECSCPLGWICKACEKPSVMHDHITIELKAMHPLTLYAYPGMHEYVIEHLRDYARFAREHLNEASIVAWQQRGNAANAHLDPGK